MPRSLDASTYLRAIQAQPPQPALTAPPFSAPRSGSNPDFTKGVLAILAALRANNGAAWSDELSAYAETTLGLGHGGLAALLDLLEARGLLIREARERTRVIHDRAIAVSLRRKGARA